MTAAFRIFSWRIMHPQPILLRWQPFCFSDAVPKSMLDITKTMNHAVVSQFALGDSRCNTSLAYVPATFSCVCKCCDFAPATCRLSVHYTRFCRGNNCPCNMTPRVWPLLSSITSCCSGKARDDGNRAYEPFRSMAIFL